jgi:hypothetical protein
MDEFLLYYDDQWRGLRGWSKLAALSGRRHLVHPIALSSARLPPGLLLEDCLRELPVVAPTQTLVGWDALARLARLFGRTWVIGVIGGVPPFSWLGRILYRHIARNRYAVSRCRGGACGSAKPAEVPSRTTLGAFWSCRIAGFTWRLPLVVGRLGAFAVAQPASVCADVPPPSDFTRRPAYSPNSLAARWRTWFR